MSEFMNIKDFLKKIKKKGVRNWIDKLTFFHILFIWTTIVVFFGFIYYFFQNGNSHLIYLSSNTTNLSVVDNIYFSFVSATTTGFGDVVPIGFFKVISIFEVVLGLLLLALVTSKLVSIKQDVILEELYEMSFNDKINGLRGSLLLFRQNLDRIIMKIEDGSFKKREIDNLYFYVSSFEDILNEILDFMSKPMSNRFVKSIDPVTTELIFNAVISSFKKLNELITSLEYHNIEWKREITLTLIQNSIRTTDNLFVKLNLSKNLMQQTLKDLNSLKNDVVGELKKKI